jgi:hypothetical protein
LLKNLYALLYFTGLKLIVIMVRECHRSRQWGARGGGVTPPVASTPEGSNPKGDEQVLE